MGTPNDWVFPLIISNNLDNLGVPQKLGHLRVGYRLNGEGFTVLVFLLRYVRPNKPKLSSVPVFFLDELWNFKSQAARTHISFQYCEPASTVVGHGSNYDRPCSSCP